MGDRQPGRGSFCHNGIAWHCVIFRDSWGLSLYYYYSFFLREEEDIRDRGIYIAIEEKGRNRKKSKTRPKKKGKN